METKQSTSHSVVRRKLLKHKPAYIESVGKTDVETLTAVADAPNGTGTILRLIMGATETMPLRALGYVDSALHISQILPFDQLQIIHANNLGVQVNGLSLDKVRRQSKLLAQVSMLLISAVHPESLGRILHAEDTPLDLEPFVPLAEKVLLENTDIGEVLSLKGARHKGEHVTYTAAHCAFQDTDRLKLRPLIEGLTSPPQRPAERIVSIGCKQERTFYAARMAMRVLMPEDELVDTAQIFTNHVSPPYFMSRGGEVALEDALSQGFSMQRISDIAARRDINHLISVINGEGVKL